MKKKIDLYFCKKHKKETLHTVYSYGLKEEKHCVDCSREYKVKRYNSDKNYKERDNAYAKQYRINNPEKIIQLTKRRKINIALEKTSKYISMLSFINDNLRFIQNLISIYRSDISYKKIAEHLLRYKGELDVNTLEYIRTYIINFKKAELVKKITYKESTIVKSKFKLNKTYSSLKESEKSLIRSIYKANAAEKINNEMLSLLELENKL